MNITPIRAMAIPLIVSLFNLSLHRKYETTATKAGWEVTRTTELAMDV